MGFYKYQHIEKYGTMEVEGIEVGKVYVFPKLDGTNGAVWLEEGEVICASRNRVLSIGDDNQGFCEYINNNDKIKDFLDNHPDHRLYGEWLVPHTLRTYDDDAWRKFYIFDVIVKGNHLNYDDYKPLLDEFELDYVPCICTMEDGNEGRFRYQIRNSTYLVKDGEGLGEGVVLKNYDYNNKYGRTIWAKIVRNKFKAQSSKSLGHPEMKERLLVEKEIAEMYVTEHLIDKVKSKIESEEGGWSTKFIPRLLQTVYYDLVREDMWDIIKKFKYPTISFKLLNRYATNQIKTIKPDIFS